MSSDSTSDESDGADGVPIDEGAGSLNADADPDGPADPDASEPDDPADLDDPDADDPDPDPDDPDPDDPADLVGDAQEAIEAARRRLSDVPAEVVVTNHVMGLYELAAIHLSAPEPNLAGASLAIDALACLVDGLGDRLGPDAPALRDALANIRMAFVQIKTTAATARTT